MKYILAIVAGFCVASIQGLAVQGTVRNHARSVMNLMDSLGKDALFLRKRGAISSKAKEPEDPQARIARLTKMTPTDATLNGMAQNVHQVLPPQTPYPTVGKVLATGSGASSWSRTRDMHKAQGHAPSQDFTLIKHEHGSAVGGSNRSKEGTVAANVEGRRVESRIITGKKARGEMSIELGGQVLKGNIGPNTKAHVHFRHPNPLQKFAMTSRLKGKGELATQGQGVFGSSDVTENDTNVANQQRRNPPTRE